MSLIFDEDKLNLIEILIISAISYQLNCDLRLPFWKANREALIAHERCGRASVSSYLEDHLKKEGGIVSIE